MLKETGVVLSAKELGVTEDMLEGIADATFLHEGGYKTLTRGEVIEITVDMDELDLTSAEAKATYNEIRDWVQEHYGMHVSNLNIA